MMLIIELPYTIKKKFMFQLYTCQINFEHNLPQFQLANQYKEHYNVNSKRLFWHILLNFPAHFFRDQVDHFQKIIHLMNSIQVLHSSK